MKEIPLHYPLKRREEELRRAQIKRRSSPSFPSLFLQGLFTALLSSLDVVVISEGFLFPSPSDFCAGQEDVILILISFTTWVQVCIISSSSSQLTLFSFFVHFLSFPHPETKEEEKSCAKCNPGGRHSSTPSLELHSSWILEWVRQEIRKEEVSIGLSKFYFLPH